MKWHNLLAFLLAASWYLIMVVLLIHQLVMMSRGIRGECKDPPRRRPGSVTRTERPGSNRVS